MTVSDFRNPTGSSGHITSTTPLSQLQDKRSLIDDKIINVIAYDENGNRVFTIRSDYELIKTEGSLFVQKTKLKPDIKLEYTSVSQTTVTSIDVTFTNLFMFGDNSAVPYYQMFKQITVLEVFVGYFSDVYDPEVYKSDLLSLSGNSNARALRSLEDYNLCTDCKSRMKRFLIKVMSINPTQAPPDSKLVVQCVIGRLPTFEDSAVFKIKPDKALMTFRLEDLGTEQDVKIQYAEELFQKAITQIHLRQEYPLKTTTQLRSAIDSGGTGRLSESDAESYGVRVFITDTVLQEITPSVLGQSGNASIPYSTVSAIASFSELKTNLFPTASMQTTDDGDLIVYSINDIKVDETGELYGMSSIIESLRQKYGSLPFGEFATNGTFKIPAIYEQSFSGIRTIRMPFYKEVSTFVNCIFKSRYNVADLVDYFAPNLGYESFTGFEMRIRFSTVEDENEIELRGIRERS